MTNESSRDTIALEQRIERLESAMDKVLNWLSVFRKTTIEQLGHTEDTLQRERSIKPRRQR